LSSSRPTYSSLYCCYPATPRTWTSIVQSRPLALVSVPSRERRRNGSLLAGMSVDDVGDLMTTAGRRRGEDTAPATALVEIGRRGRDERDTWLQPKATTSNNWRSLNMQTGRRRLAKKRVTISPTHRLTDIKTCSRAHRSTGVRCCSLHSNIRFTQRTSTPTWPRNLDDHEPNLRKLIGQISDSSSFYRASRIVIHGRDKKYRPCRE